MRGQCHGQGLGATPFPAEGRPDCPLPVTPPGQRSLPAATERGGMGEDETQVAISTFLRFGFSTLSFTRTNLIFELECLLRNLVVRKELKIKFGLRNIVL